MAWLVWLIVGVVLLGVEAMTLTFVAVYFGVAGLAAAIVAGLGAPLWSQVLIFCGVSLLGMGLTRRIATRMFRGPVVKSNVHTLAGRRGVVTQPIDAGEGRGQVRIGTEYWTARAYFEDAPAIPSGARVEVVRVEGVTAIVLPIDEPV
ncbi:MAG: NfeD family protein [Actinobacteria bacterium]|nr:NfeD family protein [Actinomycetota bacterium]